MFAEQMTSKAGDQALWSPIQHISPTSVNLNWRVTQQYRSHSGNNGELLYSVCSWCNIWQSQLPGKGLDNCYSYAAIPFASNSNFSEVVLYVVLTYKMHPMNDSNLSVRAHLPIFQLLLVICRVYLWVR